MPIYQFICESCKKSFDTVVYSIKDLPLKCECGGELKRQFPDNVHHRYNGSGFHKTDYTDKDKIKSQLKPNETLV